MKVIFQRQKVLKVIRDSLSMQRNSNFANCKAVYINRICLNMAKGDEDKNAWHSTTGPFQGWESEERGASKDRTL